MPPRLQTVRRLTGLIQSDSIPIAPFLLPFLHSQHRPASVLSSLSDNQSAYKKKIRRGRGPSSGKGKTSGRGHKGQKQHGKVPAGFNGGQTPDEVVHGVRGFTNVFSEDMVPLNLSKLQSWIDQGRLDPSKPITIKELAASRCASNIKDGVKLLAGGSEHVKHPLNVIVSRASASAIAAIEAAGGSVTTRYYTPASIKRIIRGKTDPIHSLKSVIDIGESEREQRKKYEARLPDPTSRKDMEYYRDPAKRGYLSYQVGEGQGPSLFFKTPRVADLAKKVNRPRAASAVENRLW